MKYYFDFTESAYYEPTIGITVSNKSAHEVYDGYSIEITDNKSLMKVFQQCYLYPFGLKMPHISASTFLNYMESFSTADMDIVKRNMELIDQIESRCYDFKHPNKLLTKIFGDTHEYGAFYQRFILFNEPMLIVRHNFIEVCKQRLTTKEQLVLFKDDKIYHAEKNAEHQVHLKQKLKTLTERVKQDTAQIERIKKELEDKK